MWMNEKGKVEARVWNLALRFGNAMIYQSSLKLLTYETSRPTETHFGYAWG
jgi:hypothetical protein